MARINIEDSLFRDSRFTKLCIKMQSSPMAIGSLVEAWCVAQEFWKNSDNGIPKPIWLSRGLSHEIIDVGLAVEIGDFIYMSGSRQNFQWLRDSVENGKKGGKARMTGLVTRNHSGKFQAKPSDSSPPTLTPPLTQKKEKKKEPDGSPSVVKIYAEAFERKYGKKPILTEVECIQLASLKKKVLAPGQLNQLIDYYFNCDNKFYNDVAHNAMTLVRNVSALNAKMDQKQKTKLREIKHDDN